MKTKRITSLAAGLFFSLSVLHAQRFDGGIAAGVTTGSVNLSKINTAVLNTANGDNILGFNAGLFARLHLGPFYIKPMGLISYQSGQLDFNYKTGAVEHANFSAGKFEVPVLLGIHFFRVFNIEAGPVYNSVFQTSSGGNTGLAVQPSGYGYRLGANLKLSRILLGFAYQGLYNNSSGSSTTTFQTPNELIFEIGFYLGKKK